MKWTFDLSAGRFVSFVHFQVDVRGGSENPHKKRGSQLDSRKHVFVHFFPRNRSGSLVQTPEVPP
jgi:hypothetical protein